MAKQTEDARVAALAERRRQDAAAESVRVAAAPAVAPHAAPVQSAPVLSDKPVADASARAFVDRISDEPATLTLGAINERLAPIQISGSGVSELGLVGTKDGRATRYSEQQYRFLLAALAMHLQGLLNPETTEMEAA